MKFKLKISGIINIALALNNVLTKGINAKIILLALSGGLFIHLSDKPLKWLKGKKSELLALGLINVFFSVISSIIITYGCFVIDKETEDGTKKVKSKQSISETKTQITLVLGIVFVLMAGLYYATTTFELISDAIKLLSLIFIGAIFLIFSKFFEEKRKYDTGTLSYWVLSMSFFVLTYVTICYFSLFGPYFSFNGPGHALAYTGLYVLISLIAYISLNKFQREDFRYIYILGLLASYVYFLEYLQLSVDWIITAVGMLITYVNIYDKKTTPNMKVSKKIFDLITYVLAFYILFNYKSTSNSLLLLNMLIIIGNLTFLSFNRKAGYHNYIVPILSNFIIYTNLQSYTALKLSTLSMCISTLLMVIYVYSYIVGTLAKERTFNKSYQISYNIFAIIQILNGAAISPVCLAVNSSLFMLSYFLIVYFGKDKKYYEIEYSILPLKVIVYVISILSFVNQTALSLTFVNIFNIGFSVLLLSYIYTKDKNLQYKFFAYATLTLICALIVNSVEGDILSAITILIGFLLIYTTSAMSTNNKYSDSKVYNYSFLLCSIYSLIICSNCFKIPLLLSYSITIGILVLIAILHRNKENPWYYIFPIILIGISLNKYLNLLLWPKYFGIIIANTYCIMTVLFATSKLINRISIKELINNITIFVLLSYAILQFNIVVNIYVGIVSALLICASLYEQKYSYLFYLGVVSMVLNVIGLSRSVWQYIPSIAYLLILGIALIGVAIYRETKGNK